MGGGDGQGFEVVPSIAEIHMFLRMDFACAIISIARAVSRSHGIFWRAAYLAMEYRTDAIELSYSAATMTFQRESVGCFGVKQTTKEEYEFLLDSN